MTLQDIKRQRYEVLESVRADMENEMIPARMVPIDDESDNKEPEMLTALFEDLAVDGDDVVGFFFFAPTFEDDEVQIFHNLFTIQEGISDDRMSELAVAVSILNSYLPVGSFTIDFSEKSLVYRHAYETLMPISGEQLKDSVDLSMGIAIQMIQRFGYLMVEVADGRRDAASVMEAAL